MLQIRPLAIAASLVVFCAGDTLLATQPAARSVPAELLAAITKLTGPQPADCGQHLLAKPFAQVNAEELERSLTCAIDAAKNRRPFWTVKESQGIDSLVFEGLVGMSDGTVRRFFYDSAPCGGPGCAGRFTTTPCEKPTVVSERGFARFECAK